MQQITNYLEYILSKKYNIKIENISVQSHINFGAYYDYSIHKYSQNTFHYSVNWYEIKNNNTDISFNSDKILVEKDEYNKWLRKNKLKILNNYV